MRNDNFAEKISLWLDDQLSPAEIEELEAHLVDCHDCRHIYNDLRRVDQLFQAAAGQMAAPSPGFSQRFEARLAQRQPVELWQVWAAVGALFLGTMLIFGAWAIVSSLTLVNASAMLFDAGIFYQGFVALIESAGGIRILVNLGALLLKASLIMMQQPLFWGGVLITVSLIGLWVWFMRGIFRRAMAPVELLI
jgi:predicted anti-sigma-YlaC factor YlaD